MFWLELDSNCSFREFLMMRSQSQMAKRKAQSVENWIASIKALCPLRHEQCLFKVQNEIGDRQPRP